MSARENKRKIQQIREEHKGIITITAQNPKTGEYETTKVRIVGKLDRYMNERAAELGNDYARDMDLVFKGS